MSQVPGLIKDGVITGGMIPKVDCCGGGGALRREVAQSSWTGGSRTPF